MVRAVRKEGVIAIALSSVCIGPAVRNGLSIGFGGFEPALIERGVQCIASALRRAKPAAAHGVAALPGAA